MEIRKLFTMMLLTLMATGAWAQSEMDQHLVVWLTDGTKVTHDLSDQPETTFQDGSLFLNTDKVSVSYPLEKVLRYTYEGSFPDVGVQPIKSGEMRFLQGADEMCFDGLPVGTPLQLYAPDGKLLSTQRAAKGQTAVVSLKGMPQGTYIVKTGDATYKFLKK